MEHKIAARIAALRRHRIRTDSFQPGTPPGTLEAVPPDPVAAPPARVSLMHYQRDGEVLELAAPGADQWPAPVARQAGVTWLHLQGAPSASQLQQLGERFGVHPLALEDVFNRERRPKLDSYDGQQFIVLSHLHRAAGDGIGADQVSFFLGPGYLISIDEGARDLFEPVRQHIRGHGKIRGLGADFLLYSLMDVIVDSGFALLEALGDELEVLEDEILRNPSQEARDRLHYAKRELMVMRRAAWPQREVVAALMRDDEHLVSDTTRIYLRDCHEHCVFMVDFVESYREMATSLLDTYLSAMSQRMNDIMKALTVIATIFLPLTFITGLYGMNFDTSSPWNLPELHWRFGYLYVLAVMATVVVVMVTYFRRKRWL